jgi:hypothetical protein
MWVPSAVLSPLTFDLSDLRYVDVSLKQYLPICDTVNPEVTALLQHLDRPRYTGTVICHQFFSLQQETRLK